MLEAPSGMAFPKALDFLRAEYAKGLKEKNLGRGSAVFSRVYVSDIENRKKCLFESDLFRELSEGAVSVVEQRPLEGGPLGLLSYHILPRGQGFARKMSGHPTGKGSNSLLVEGNHYRMLWIAGANGNGKREAGGQTGEILNSLSRQLESAGMDWLPEGIRSWIFVRDIDNDYSAMSDTRLEFFARKGLTESTRFLASTGIEGRMPRGDSLVGFDLLCIEGLDPAQIVRMVAPDRLSPTLRYGVTFERGLRVDFGDRSHLYLSGTASIGSQGELLHAGDAEGQTRRTVENLEALLEAQGATLGDLAYAIVYVRDPALSETVREALRNLLPGDLPQLVVEARVCRPGWLVEIEGMAIVPAKTAYPPFL